MSVQFETPENVTISYQPAGLGTRFMAACIDALFLLVPYLLIILLLVAVYLKGDWALGELHEKIKDKSVITYVALILSVLLMLWGILSVAYFAVFELLMRGQTPGKRIMKLRVVKAGGFALDAASVIIRSVFRVLDNLPPVWAVVFFSPLNQRLGDMVGKTVVVYDTPPDIAVQDLKEQLLRRERGEGRYAFNAVLAQKTPWESVLAAEKILLRWGGASMIQKERFHSIFCKKLAEMHQIPVPDIDSDQSLLEEYLILRYRQQYRRLG